MTSPVEQTTPVAPVQPSVEAAQAEKVEAAPVVPDTSADAEKAARNDWKAEARKWEDRAKENDQKTAALAAKLEAIQKAFSPGSDQPPTAEELQSKLDQYQADARKARTEVAVIRAVGAHGADVDALMDSRSFVNSLDALDPADPGFAEAVSEAVKEAVKNPRYRADIAPAPKATSGQAPTVANPAAQQQRSAEEVSAMSASEYAAYRKDVLGI